jgi:hypothetical protein
VNGRVTDDQLAAAQLLHHTPGAAPAIEFEHHHPSARDRGALIRWLSS